MQLLPTGRQNKGDCGPSAATHRGAHCCGPSVPCAGGTGALVTLASSTALSKRTGSAEPLVCRPSVHPAASAGPTDWPPISSGSTSSGLVSYAGTAGCTLQDCCMMCTKAHPLPWEMYLKTSHQTAGLTRMCVEKGLGWTKVGHIVSSQGCLQPATVWSAVSWHSVRFRKMSKNVNPRHTVPGQFFSLYVVPLGNYFPAPSCNQSIPYSRSTTITL